MQPTPRRLIAACARMIIRVDIDSDFILIRFGYDLDLRVLENPDHLLGNEDGSPDPNTLFNFRPTRPAFGVGWDYLIFLRLSAVKVGVKFK